MVVKKKKTEDKKEIEKLKKKLKSLTAKYLKERKKRVKNPKEFKKIQDNIKSKVEQASSQQDISKLLTLLGAVKQNQPINEVSKGTIQSRLNRENILIKKKEQKKQDLADSYREIKSDFINLKDKYNNNTIQVEDIKNLYLKSKGFANNIQEELPSLSSLMTMYQSAKKTYEYIRRFLNNNRPAQENPINLNDPPPQRNQQQSSPPPPPPPPVESEIPQGLRPNFRGEPLDLPEAPQIPRIVQGNIELVNMYNNLLGNTISPSALAMGVLSGGGLLGRLNQRIRGRQNENNQLAEQNLAQNLGEVAQNLGQSVVARNLEDNLDTNLNIQNRLQENRETIDNARNLIDRIREERLERESQRNIRQQRDSDFRIREAEEQARLELGNRQRNDIFRTPRPRVGAREMRSIKEGEDFVDRGTEGRGINIDELQPEPMMETDEILME